MSPSDAKTEADLFILEQVQSLLEPGEEVLLVGHLNPVMGGSAVAVVAQAHGAKAAFAVVTTTRLLLIRTRVGAFRPLLENHGVVAIERSRIGGVHRQGGHLYFEVDGAPMVIPVNYRFIERNGPAWLMIRTRGGSAAGPVKIPPDSLHSSATSRLRGNASRSWAGGLELRGASRNGLVPAWRSEQSREGAAWSRDWRAMPASKRWQASKVGTKTRAGTPSLRSSDSRILTGPLLL